MPVAVLHAAALDALAQIPDNSIDAICTDPPYGLTNTTPADVADTIKRWATGDRAYTPTGRGFMGHAWDAFVPPPAMWDECFRVLKPGGHMAVFAGSRTQDLMGMSIRLAGFDLRDSVAWLYGQGFPKSQNVSKSDKFCQCEHGTGRRLRDGAPSGHGGMDRAAAVPDGSGQPQEPRPAGQQAGEPGAISDERGSQEGRGWPVCSRCSKSVVPSGLGTALKPGHEPIILARKPFPGTVAANVQEHGTGALNIDATRIETTDNLNGGRYSEHGGGEKDGGTYGSGINLRTPGAYAQPAGRWPANVVLDPDTAKALDQQSGITKDGVATNRNRGDERPGFVAGAPRKVGAKVDVGYGGQGGASRFFKVVEPDPPFMYAAKAPKRERPSCVAEDGTVVSHPTVKPVSIMVWLIRLICPSQGTVLDPFAGTGTTGEAAASEGRDAILIESHAPYLPLIHQRLARAVPDATLFTTGGTP